MFNLAYLVAVYQVATCLGAATVITIIRYL